MRPGWTAAQTGIILVADGRVPVRRWDGMGAWEEAGTQPPASGPSLAGSGTGQIVGDYWGYLRYVDKKGNVSNLSPLSSQFSATGNSGLINNVTDDTPIQVTVNGSHGLSSGDLVKIEGVGGVTDANGVWEIITTGTNSFQLKDSSGAGTYNGGGTWRSGISQINYSGLEVPSDPAGQLSHKQVLRNTDGQAEVFYVDVDNIPLAQTTATSTLIDSDLQSEEAVSLFDDLGESLANRHGRPPANFTAYASHKDRIFATLDLDYKEGHVEVTNGSASVTGIGVSFGSSFVGRNLYVDGAPRSYPITAATATTLTLGVSYTGATNKLARYAIRSDPGYWKTIQYSESNLPESWHPASGFSLPEDGDSISGQMPMGSFIYILERRHTYRFTYQSYPALDGAVFQATGRGCVNNRCWITVDGVAYLMDEEGCYRLTEGETVEPISEEIGDLFSTTHGHGKGHVQWQSAERFHACLFVPDSVIRWFVSLDGSYWPRHALCYNYRAQRWWIEDYPFPVSGSAYGRLAGVPQLYLTGPFGQVYAQGGTALDGGPAPPLGTLTAASRLSLEDDTRSFSSSLLGRVVTIASGKALGQRRRITAVSGSTLSLDRPLVPAPAIGDYYQIGGIPYRWRSGRFRVAEGEEQVQRRLELGWEPERQPSLAILRLYKDYSDVPLVWDYTEVAEDSTGFGVAAGNADLLCYLNRTYGLAWKRLPGHREIYTEGFRYLSIGLFGTGGPSTTTFYSITLDGVAEPGQ